jgi:hypothetical protein
MAEALFDIQFAGKILEGADPNQVRARVQRLFKLSDEAAERLFGGSPVTIKRGIDAATASRFREVFRAAGARVSVVPAGTEPSRANRQGAAATGEEESGQRARAIPSPSASSLRLVPAEHPDPLEPPRRVDPPGIDTSYLQLVEGSDWTLEDCEPYLAPVRLPDISHLTILPTEDETTASKGGTGS